MDKKLEEFLTEFKDAIIKKHGEKIFSFILYGSFAAGKAELGKSDFDAIIQLKRGHKKEEVHDIISLFLELDKKHGTKLPWNWHDPILRRIHPPVLILDFNGIDWKEAKFKDRLINFIIEISVSRRLFFASLKKEGKVLHGENVLKLIEAEPNLADELRAKFSKPVQSLWKRISRIIYS